MARSDVELADRLRLDLQRLEQDYAPLPGIRDAQSRNVLILQLVASVHRVQYVRAVLDRDISIRRADPDDPMFDPVKAAILAKRSGRSDEAFWLVFLFVHFGKHRLAGYRYAREIYGRLGEPGLWDWASVSENPLAFRAWLNTHQSALMRPGAPRGFGNHRKYESLDAHKPRGTGAVVESYVRWIGPPRTHVDVMNTAIETANGDPRHAFRALYNSLDTVISFGRMARFDYLAMVGKLGLASIEPDSMYLRSSTGPLVGFRLLFEDGARLRPSDVDARAHTLVRYLNVGMQAMEDAVCNWQKAPTQFRRFRG